MFCKKGVLKKVANFTGIHLRWGLFLIKFQAFRPATLLKKDSYTDVFSWNLRHFQEHLFQRNSADECIFSKVCKKLSDSWSSCSFCHHSQTLLGAIHLALTFSNKFSEKLTFLSAYQWLRMLVSGKLCALTMNWRFMGLGWLFIETSS